MKLGLDIGTGFVKCMSDYGAVRFPSVYVRRIHGVWTEKTAEAVGAKAVSMLDTIGTTAISPISRGRPDSRYYKQVDMLLAETLQQVRRLAKSPIDDGAKLRIVVGLPYHAFGYRDSMVKVVQRSLNVEKCSVAAQASGTLVDMDLESAIVVSIGQGTTEIVVIDDLEVIDGESSRWASDFVTKKIGRLAHLDVGLLHKSQDVCQRYSKTMAENLAREVSDMSQQYGNQYPIALSGGGLLIPGMQEKLVSKLKTFKVTIPDDPVMSNANGLYKLVT